MIWKKEKFINSTFEAPARCFKPGKAISSIFLALHLLGGGKEMPGSTGKSGSGSWEKYDLNYWISDLATKGIMSLLRKKSVMMTNLIGPSVGALQIFRRSTWPSYIAAAGWKRNFRIRNTYINPKSSIHTRLKKHFFNILLQKSQSKIKRNNFPRTSNCFQYMMILPARHVFKYFNIHQKICKKQRN